jgi:DNA-binding SARP family transcriptional activator/tetratricopeptide (TPR) repeat protein
MSDPGGPAVRFEVLGPLRSWRGDVAIDLGPVQQRVVLAVLLLQQNRAIGRQQVINAVWGDAEPRHAGSLLHRHVSGLRHVLELSRYPPAESGQLAWTNAGYVLTVPAGGLDLEAFDREVDTARKARTAGDLASAAEVLRSALGLWRGPLCDGLTSPFLDAQRGRLEERRISIIEEWIELDLTIGDRDDLVSELRQLVTEHPFRERMHGLLMLALYRAGRRADALAAFHEARRLLREELGVEPAAELQRLHQQVLSADPELGSRAYQHVPSAGSSPGGNRLPVPAQLPHSVAGFSGRKAEIDWLNGLLPDESAGTAETVVISALAGTAGVGKTALALHWAHQIRERFPDGQLYANLRGFDPAGSAMEPKDAIRAFLDALAVPPERIPVDLDEQAALYRTMLSGRRSLIVLDNARDAAQVRPLLPGTPTCLVLVTSRNQLLSLVAADGARLLEIDLLPAEQARGLLASRLGEKRVAAEPAAVDEIVDACAGLPLALSIVSARAAVNPRLPLAGLAGELREKRGGLDGLNVGDKQTDLRDVFSWSYHALSAPAGRLFRLLGLHEGPDVGVAAAASLAGIPLSQARALMAELASAHLLADRSRGRFAFHDLLRTYARELADAHNSAADRRAAVHRVLDHYLWTAYRANELLGPSRDDAITVASAAPLATPEELVDHRNALAWFTAEYQVLLAALRQAANQGFDVHAWQLAWAMASFFERRGHWHEAATSQRLALEAANRLGDPYAQAISHACLAAYAYVPLGRYAEAEDHLMQALALYESLGDRTGQARAHWSLALLFDRQDRYAEALDHAQQAFERFQAEGHRTGQARAMNAVGWFHIQLGHHQEGLSYCQQALDLQREINDQDVRADTLDSIATAYAALGNHEEAIAHYQQAVRLYREFGHRHPEADILACLGDLHLTCGRPTEAREAWQEALAIFDELGHSDAAQLREKLEQLASRPGIVSPA